MQMRVAACKSFVQFSFALKIALKIVPCNIALRQLEMVNQTNSIFKHSHDLNDAEKRQVSPINTSTALPIIE